MSHAQPCHLGFNGSPCPECHRAESDAHTRLDLQLRVAEAPDNYLRDVAYWFLTHDVDHLADAFNETEQQS